MSHIGRIGSLDDENATVILSAIWRGVDLPPPYALATPPEQRIRHTADPLTRICHMADTAEQRASARAARALQPNAIAAWSLVRDNDALPWHVSNQWEAAWFVMMHCHGMYQINGKQSGS